MRVRRREDDGFTLVELLLSMSILGVILTSITTALIVFLKNADYTLARDDHSGGAAVAASYLDRDLASADSFATGGSTCSGSTNALTLSWGEAKASVATPEPNPTGGGTFVAAYHLEVDSSSVPVGGGTRYRLVRSLCTNGGAPSTTRLVVNLRQTDFTAAASTTATCGGTADELVVTLQTYLDDVADDYRFNGCLKGRLG